MSKCQIEKIEKDFAISVGDMHKLMRAFHLEMDRGLAGRKSVLQMIPTYVDRPTGREKGEFIALDLGGTNFRILELTLKGGGKVSVPKIMKFVIDKRLIKGEGSRLFDFIAECMKKFIDKYKMAGREELKLGFTFSFPVKQAAVASGKLACWTKGFSASNVIGEDVVRLLEEALDRKGLSHVRVSALLNDTVGTLVTRAYSDHQCDIGVIIGTGTNACYTEAASKIKKWHGPSKNSGHMIINTEWGNFNKLKCTSYDRALDRMTENKTYQILEKTVSGMYLGELARLILKDLRLSAVFDNERCFKTEYMSAILADNSVDLKAAGRLLKEIGAGNMSFEDRALVKKICSIVALRAGRISAAGLAAIVTKMDPALLRRHTIAIDGSVYEKLPGFAGNIRLALRELFGGRASRIRIALAKDGSGKGAAIVAAVADGELCRTIAAVAS